MSRISAEKRAHRLLAESGMYALPIDPARLAVFCGADVVEGEADEAESGFCLRDADRIVIGVNSAHHEHRKRFTLAHEIGHLLLHNGRELTVDKSIRVSYRNEISSMATDYQEIEANAFAAALLMPSGIVREEASPWVQAGSTEAKIMSALAKLFNVSEQAMTYRLVNLGILLG